MFPVLASALLSGDDRLGHVDEPVFRLGLRPAPSVDEVRVGLRADERPDAVDDAVAGLVAEDQHHARRDEIAAVLVVMGQAGSSRVVAGGGLAEGGQQRHRTLVDAHGVADARAQPLRSSTGGERSEVVPFGHRRLFVVAHDGDVEPAAGESVSTFARVPSLPRISSESKSTSPYGACPETIGLLTTLAPREAIKPGFIGFEQYDEDSAGPLSVHRPTPKQRTRVMKRDGYRCQLCGERPALNEHIVLTVHHITPFGSGGLTQDENLITLCHTCHRGLDPHEDLSLYLVPGGQVDRALAAHDGESHELAVERYRELVRRVYRHDQKDTEGS